MANNVNQSEVRNVATPVKTARKNTIKIAKPPKPQKLERSKKKCSYPGCYEKILACRYELGETTCHIHDEILMTFRKLYSQDVSPRCNHYRCAEFPKYLDTNTNIRYCNKHKPDGLKLFIRFPYPNEVRGCSVMNCTSSYECSNIDERTGLVYCALDSPKTCLHLEYEEFKKCGSVMCDRIIPKDLIDKYCKLHQPDTQSSVVMAGCCFSCSKTAVYGVRIGGDALYCIDHKEEGMVCVDGSAQKVDVAPQELIECFPITSIIIQDSHSAPSELSELLLGSEEKDDDVICISDSNISINEGERASKFQKLEAALTDEELEVMRFENIFDGEFNEYLMTTRYQ